MNTAVINPHADSLSPATTFPGRKGVADISDVLDSSIIFGRSWINEKALSEEDRASLNRVINGSSNALFTVFSALQLVGNLIGTAASGEPITLDAIEISTLGCLSKHLAVEADLLHGMQRDAECILGYFDKNGRNLNC